MKTIEASSYRSDIDGMRAIAVIAVIIYHLGHLPNGYLGVDMFFVISGYLITGIIYRALLKDNFSVKDFYERRIRRIIPLVTFISLVALSIGVAVMLPDDLENLADSVVATSFFSNNILQAITTRNYWDVVNEYKPLMHTWSLAIEEQYYFLYPFIFLLLKKKRIKLVLPILIALTIISLILFFMPFEAHKKFYYLPFRFFELSIGGILSVVLGKKLIKFNFTIITILLIVTLFYADLSFISNEILIISTVILSGLMLVSANSENQLSKYFLENKLFVFIGRISFSLYMWHQVIFAFARYFVFEEIDGTAIVLLSALTLILSVGTYYLVEQPFRNRHKYSMKSVLWGLGISLAIINAGAIYLYLNAGVYKDIPELGISKDNVSRNMHAKYNDRVFEYERDFSSSDKAKVLVIGNSFARDWVNVLLESEYAKDIEVAYIYGEFEKLNRVNKLKTEADIIFYSEATIERAEKIGLPREKVWCVGTKNFGFNNGIFYNASKEGYCDQRTFVDNVIRTKDEILKAQWGDRYIDILGMVEDENGEVPVFSPDCKFISQDCRHFTKAGAETFAEIISEDKSFMLKDIIESHK